MARALKFFERAFKAPDGLAKAGQLVEQCSVFEPLAVFHSGGTGIGRAGGNIVGHTALRGEHGAISDFQMA